MSGYGESISTDTVRIERLLPGPIERVWSYLTDSEKRGKWLAAGVLEPRVGGKVELHFDHASLTPHHESRPVRFQQNNDCSDTFAGTVTQFDPPRLLAYTWGGETSEVQFELTSQDTKVLLVITHTRLRHRDEKRLVASGWHTHLDVLEDHLLGRTPRPFWATFEQVENEYRERM